MDSENGSPDSTLRRKVRRFGQQKIAGLRRKCRQDRGQARKQRQQMIARAVELKRQQPGRAPRTINKFLAQGSAARFLPRP